jgi:iron complex outermembrane receptor protein
MTRFNAILLCGVSLGLSPTAAWAQASTDQPAPPGPAAVRDDAIPDIVITATRTGETAAQRTPIAISVLSGDRLGLSGATDVRSLVAITPNLNVSQTTASAQIYIRGIGSNNVFNGSDPSVTVQSDGIYIARAFGQFADFIDVDRIEVLRGPQGTLYGRNAVGGTINIISRRPTDEFSARAQVTVGTFDLFQVQGYVNVPLVPGLLAASLSGNYLRHDHYIDNVVPNQPGTNNADRGGLRFQARLTPSSSVEMITRIDWSKLSEDIETGDHLFTPFPAAPLATSLIGDFTRVALNSPHTNNQEIWGISEEINLTLSNVFRLKSLTAFRHSEYDLTVDTDGTELTRNIGRQIDLSRQFTQEFNLTANTAAFDGVAGVYYFREHETSLVQSDVPPPGPNFRNAVTPVAHARSVAAFAQGIFHVTEALNLTVGIRYTRDRKQVDQTYNRTSLANGASLPGFPFIASATRQFDAFTPRFGVDYTVVPGLMLYASATRGFKSGGTNYAALTPAALSFEPETIWAYEGGIKSDWFGRRLRVNVTGFIYDYSNLQVQQLIGPGDTRITNAANARVTGLEIETIARPFDSLLLTANYTFLDAHYVDFTNAAVSASVVPFLTRPRNPNGSYDASGNQLNAAPRNTFSATAQFSQPLAGGSAYLRGEYYWQSRAYYDPTNVAIMSQAAYDLVNLALGWNSRDSTWNIQLLARNVTQTRYVTTVTAIGVVPGGIAAPPRTLQLQIGRRF